MEKTKICCCCKCSKPLTEFYKNRTRYDGYNSMCKICARDYKSLYKEANSEEIAKKNAEYFQKKYRTNEAFRKQLSEQSEKWKRNKRATDIGYHILCNLRPRVHKAMKGINKGARTKELLGCTIEELKSHLEMQFSEGMTWDNYGRGGWEIDHIIPCSSFDMTIPANRYECFHFSNLQPLWAKDNATKHAKLP